jgi:DNA-directed RNA polymerase subunit RPC12/RpoP
MKHEKVVCSACGHGFYPTGDDQQRLNSGHPIECPRCQAFVNDHINTRT